eukprot:3726165-Prymnesium_polylepis.1
MAHSLDPREAGPPSGCWLVCALRVLSLVADGLREAPRAPGDRRPARCVGRLHRCTRRLRERTRHANVAGINVANELTALLPADGLVRCAASVGAGPPRHVQQAEALAQAGQRLGEARGHVEALRAAI